LPDLYRQEGREDLVTIPMTPDQYAWGALKEYKEQGILAEQAHTNAWKLTLAITIASDITALDRTWGQDARAAVNSSGVPDPISSTARRRNSRGYAGRVPGIWTPFLPEPCGPSARVSTKPGQLHRGTREANLSRTMRAARRARSA
jgi:hypothetical protein